ncbi:LacI family DNA-binding transcriptional regulator [Kineococcus sp. LSe6-4]|uniref:LacI family DNA-binding transcriptional regulator n=1 Tax=Kineococcus halophytocola TaxID=3234027 RepID=A0ABV4H3H9_9ACTN
MVNPHRVHRAASMIDVARRAGVSAQTVSRVVNDRPHVDPATRARVLEALEHLGYRRNPAAVSLATGRYRTIGVVASTLTTHGAVLVLDGMTEEVARHGYSLTLSPLRAPTLGAVSEALTSFAGAGVDAVVLGVESELVRSLPRPLVPGLPVVVVDGAGTTEGPTAESDPAPGLLAAMTHLLDLGHRQVRHLAGPPDSATAARRRELWRGFLTGRGLDVVEPLVTDWSAASGLAAGAELLRTDPAATAVVAANDQVALGLVRACADAGVRVPDDLSVVGFDDVEHAGVAVPRLSTVQHDLREVGRRAVRQLLHDLGVLPQAPPWPVPSAFVPRESTAPPPSPPPSPRAGQQWSNSYPGTPRGSRSRSR